MLDPLIDVARFALDELVVPVGVAVATAISTAKALKWRDAGGEVADHDRRAAELNEDLRRWIRDRHRAAGVRMSEIAQQAAANGVTSGGILAAAAGKVYRHVLHEYRDHASRIQRELDAFLAREGRAHARHRRRRNAPAPRLTLPDDCRALLAEWRQRAEDDPARLELEPRLTDLERPLLAA